MYFDIAIGVVLALFLLMGWVKGFMCGIVGFVANVLSFAIAIFSAAIVSNFVNGFVDLSGYFDTLLAGKGAFISVLACGVAVYVLCRLVFFFINRLIKKIKKTNKAVDKVDKFAGLILGVLKCALLLCTVFVVIYLLSAIPFVHDTIELAFTSGQWESVVARYLYNAVVDYVIPLIGGVMTNAFSGFGF